MESASSNVSWKNINEPPRVYAKVPAAMTSEDIENLRSSRSMPNMPVVEE